MKTETHLDYFSDLLLEEQKRHRDQVAAIIGAQRLAMRYGLQALARHASYVGVHQDYFRTEDGQGINADRYWLYIHVPATLKARLRNVALDQIHSWDKSYRVDRGIYGSRSDPELHEIWHVQLNTIYRNNYSAYDLIEIHWTSPAEPGTRLTPTCAVAEVEQRTEARVQRNLQVVCSKA
jgi:hypothetical protein